MEGIDLIRHMKRDWTPAQWCQRSLALDARGMNTDFDGGTAVSYCLLGRLFKTAFDLGLYTKSRFGHPITHPSVHDAQLLLNGAAASTDRRGMTSFNDHEDRTWGDIQGLIDGILIAHAPKAQPDAPAKTNERELVTA